MNVLEVGSARLGWKFTPDDNNPIIHPTTGKPIITRFVKVTADCTLKVRWIDRRTKIYVLGDSDPRNYQKSLNAADADALNTELGYVGLFPFLAGETFAMEIDKIWSTGSTLNSADIYVGE
jgi:hypothetical protein